MHAVLRSNKSLKVPSDSISEGLIFQNFLGGMPPDPSRFCMPNRMLLTQLSCSLQCICAPPPFVNPESAPGACNCLSMHVGSLMTKRLAFLFCTLCNVF